MGVRFRLVAPLVLLGTIIILGQHFLLAVPQVVAQGVLSGTVLDEAERPLQSARVHAQLRGVPMASAIRYVETDENGAFAIDLKYGTYDVHAMKEEAGYPDSSWSFYADKPLAAPVEITEQSPSAKVTLKLGPRAGVIVGAVKDAATGKPIPAGFMLRRLSAPSNFLSTSEPPEFRVLIPAATDITLEVSASGYKSWRYGDGSRPLRLDSGAEMHLDVLLERETNGKPPTRFLVPEGYVGWQRLEYNVEGASTVSDEGGVRVFRFPSSGILTTSSPGPEDEADIEYLYYSTDGSVKPVSSDYWHGDGRIWGEHAGSHGGRRSEFGFFVGTQEQYGKATSHPFRQPGK